MRSYGSAAPSEAAANEHGAHDPVSGSADASVADIDDDGIFDTGNRWSNVGWATMGFLSGAVFWHAVGFWPGCRRHAGRSRSTARELPGQARSGPAGN